MAKRIKLNSEWFDSYEVKNGFVFIYKIKTKTPKTHPNEFIPAIDDETDETYYEFVGDDLKFIPLPEVFNKKYINLKELEANPGRYYLDKCIKLKKGIINETKNK